MITSGFYRQGRPVTGWVFRDCSGYSIMLDIWRGRFMALGIVTEGFRSRSEQTVEPVNDTAGAPVSPGTKDSGGVEWPERQPKTSGSESPAWGQTLGIGPNEQPH